MNIGILYLQPLNESMGSDVRLRGICKSISNSGNNCYYFTPFKYQEDWGKNTHFIQIPALIEGSKVSKKIFKAAKWFLNKPLISRNIFLSPPSINKMVDRFSKALLNAINSNNLKLDVIQGEQELGALSVTRIKDKLKIPVIADLHNFWPEELVVSGVLKRNHKAFSFLKTLEQELLANSDHIFTSSDNFGEYLKENFKFDHRKISTLFPGFTPRIEKTQQRDETPRVVYSGLVVPRANVELFIEAIPYILKRNPKVEFYITDKGESIGKIKELVKKNNLNVNFFWYENFEDYIKFISSSSVGIVTSSDDLPRKFGVAGKIFDFFGMGVPVVANDVGSWTNIIRDEKVGIVTNNSPEQIAEAILKFLNDPKLSMEYGQRGIELVKSKYDWNEIVTHNYLKVIKEKFNI